MSSVDSSLLSGASYLTHNIYAAVIRPPWSEPDATARFLKKIF
jgi:Na+/proline symporter